MPAKSAVAIGDPVRVRFTVLDMPVPSPGAGGVMPLPAPRDEWRDATVVGVDQGESIRVAFADGKRKTLQWWAAWSLV